MSNKIFVGNVPYNCTRDEFINIFSNMQGYVNADIIKRYKSSLSRGFGFVNFDTCDNASKLLEMNITLKDRKLRFTPYMIKTKDGNKIYVTGLNNEMTQQKLCDLFSPYGNIIQCNILNLGNKITAIVSFSKYDEYKNILQNFSHRQIKVYPYKNKSIKNLNKYYDPQKAYQEGFKAGHLIGFQQCFEQSLQKNCETNYNEE